LNASVVSGEVGVLIFVTSDWGRTNVVVSQCLGNSTDKLWYQWW